MHASKNNRQKNSSYKMERVFSIILKNKAILKINLGVTPEQKAALKLYKTFGFKVVGRLKRDMNIKNRLYDHFIMEKLLYS